MSDVSGDCCHKTDISANMRHESVSSLETTNDNQSSSNTSTSHYISVVRLWTLEFLVQLFIHIYCIWQNLVKITDYFDELEPWSNWHCLRIRQPLGRRRSSMSHSPSPSMNKIKTLKWIVDFVTRYRFLDWLPSFWLLFVRRCKDDGSFLSPGFVWCRMF